MAPGANHPAHRIVMGAVGRLSEEKGLGYLIDAFAQLCKSGHDIELWIAGEGKAQSELEARATNSGAGDRISAHHG